MLVPEEGLAPPANIHAERTILGAMMLEASAINEASLLLRADDFSLDSHRRIFDVILFLSEENKPVDEVTVLAELARQKSVDAIGGQMYLSDLTSGIPRRLHIGAYADIVRDKSHVRQLMEICDAGMNEGIDATVRAADIIAILEERLRLLAEQTIVGGFATPMEIVSRFDSVDQFFAGKTFTGAVNTGFAFDRWTNGLKEGELVIIAARPSMGKTAWALNVAANVAKEGKVVGILSLEMDGAALLRRIIQSESRVSNRKFAKGYATTADRQNANDALETMIESNLFIDDKPFTTMQEIRAKARRLKQQHKLDLLIIDYIQLIEPEPGGKSREQEVSKMSRGLKGLAKDLGIPVIALAQLNRECEKRADKRPMLSDLRDSGSIEQDADIVAFLYREEVYDPTNPDLKGKAEFNVAKQREGPTGRMDLHYFGDITRFEDAAFESDYANQ